MRLNLVFCMLKLEMKYDTDGYSTLFIVGPKESNTTGLVRYKRYIKENLNSIVLSETSKIL